MADVSRALDETHDRNCGSWIDTANEQDCQFPLQNLPIAVFRRSASMEPFRGGIAIGGFVLDLSAPCLLSHLGETARSAVSLASSSSLNAFMAAGRGLQRALRCDLSRILRHDFREKKSMSEALVAIDQAEFRIPAQIGDFSDFYCSIHHAANVGKQFRPDNPVLPNYRWLPVGYQGRTSSILLSGRAITRPKGQIRDANSSDPVYAACRRLDYEAELAVFIGAGSALGKPIPMGEIEDHLFGVCLLNDWSARDIQSWEYQPLGPFLAKSFATSISPWIVSFDALEPYRLPHRRPAGDPAPLSHLASEQDEIRGAIDIRISVHLQTAAMQARSLAPVRLSTSTYADSYWTLAQVIAHHTSNGCNLQAGDLIGSGTVSGPTSDARACLLELTEGGRSPVALPSGETRAFLQDGDTVILSAWCEREGFARIGFGECRATVQASD
jgi:fumarylacetoacetase